MCNFAVFITFDLHCVKDRLVVRVVVECKSNADLVAEFDVLIGEDSYNSHYVRLPDVWLRVCWICRHHAGNLPEKTGKVKKYRRLNIKTKYDKSIKVISQKLQYKIVYELLDFRRLL